MLKMFEIWACEENRLLAYLEQLSKVQIGEAEIEGASRIQTEASTPLISEDGTEALVFITGILTQDGPPPIAQLFGIKGTSYRTLVETLNEIGANDEIKKVTLLMDTPGGEVNGVDSVRSAVAALAKTKTVIAENHGMVASAGYWIASAANGIVAKSAVVETGSIGVVATQANLDKARENFGIRVVKVLSKNAPNKQPDGTTKEGLAELQRRVDAIERVFIERIAEGRGKTSEEIAKTFGRGSLLVASDPDGNDALSVGMIDAVDNGFAASELGERKTFAVGDEWLRTTDNIDNSNKKIDKENKKKPASAGMQAKGKEKGMLEKLLAEHPALAAEIEKIISDAKERGVAEAQAKVKTVLPFLRDSEYPQSVKNLACDVLEGKSGVDALTGAVTVLDALKAAASTDAAAQDTTDAGETAAAEGNAGITADGVVSTEEEYQAEIAHARKNLGLEN
jgi:ClpP class serine protease